MAASNHHNQVRSARGDASPVSLVEWTDVLRRARAAKLVFAVAFPEPIDSYRAYLKIRSALAGNR